MSVHDSSFPGDCSEQENSPEMLMQQKIKENGMRFCGGEEQHSFFTLLVSANVENPTSPVPAPEKYFYLVENL